MDITVNTAWAWNAVQMKHLQEIKAKSCAHRWIFWWRGVFGFENHTQEKPNYRNYWSACNMPSKNMTKHRLMLMQRLLRPTLEPTIKP